MEKCPQCGEQTLKTKTEELKRVRAKSIGDCFSLSHSRTHDAWSLCSELCTSCGYVK